MSKLYDVSSLQEDPFCGLNITRSGIIFNSHLSSTVWVSVGRWVWWSQGLSELWVLRVSQQGMVQLQHRDVEDKFMKLTCTVVAVKLWWWRRACTAGGHHYWHSPVATDTQTTLIKASWNVLTLATVQTYLKITLLHHLFIHFWWSLCSVATEMHCAVPSLPSTNLGMTNFKDFTSDDAAFFLCPWLPMWFHVTGLNLFCDIWTHGRLFPGIPKYQSIGVLQPTPCCKVIVRFVIEVAT